MSYKMHSFIYVQIILQKKKERKLFNKVVHFVRFPSHPHLNSAECLHSDTVTLSMDLAESQRSLQNLSAEVNVDLGAEVSSALSV